MSRDQRELDLPDMVVRAPRTSSPRRPAPSFGGLSRRQLVGGLLLAAAIVWGMWVTRELRAPRGEHIVQARLSSIIGDYVQAQARSASPPGQVEAEMRRFMATLDGELQRRSARGEVVLVGEAVLSRRVPDITEALRRAVYVAGIRAPRAASPQELGRAAPLSAPPVAVAGNAATSGMSGEPGMFFAPPGPLVAEGASGVQSAGDGPSTAGDGSPQAPGASVSTFGSPGGNDRR